MKKTIIMALALTAILCQAAICEDSKVSFDGELSFVSRYIWRGFDVLPQNDPAVQPSLTATFGDSGHSLNLWGSVSADDSKDLDELDLTWDYKRPLAADMGLSAGLIYYGYPQTDDDSVEAYAGLSFPKLLLQPSVTLFADFGSGDGVYLTAGVSRSQPIGKRTYDFSLSAGWQDGYWGVEPGVSDITFSVSTPINAGLLTVVPSLNYAYVPEDSVNPDDSEFWFGISGLRKLNILD